MFLFRNIWQWWNEWRKRKISNFTTCIVVVMFSFYFIFIFRHIYPSVGQGRLLCIVRLLLLSSSSSSSPIKCRYVLCNEKWHTFFVITSAYRNAFGSIAQEHFFASEIKNGNTHRFTGIDLLIVISFLHLVRDRQCAPALCRRHEKYISNANDTQ